MEHNIRVLPPEELMSKLPELLEAAEAVPLIISGGSMAPFLIPGRDTVYLSRVSRPLKRGDMILYRRDNGQYILHRICAVTGDSYSLVGDAQQLIEQGVAPDQVLALVTAVCRKGKTLGPGNWLWVFFEKIWLRLIPHRRKLVGLYAKFTEKL